ncbi:GAF and ANTAR domain-containing protein [Amycolatopsis lurida]|uniref:GAF and ANTAR domain-containing protein n=1 Tax=Amycolatopsis lurida TaxID=31959 RepID=UPI00365E5A1F
MRLTDDHVALLGVDGMTVSATTSGSAELAWASDEASARLDDEQFTFGEGPVIDAIATGAPVLCSALDVTARWPGFTAAALERDVHAVFAFPVMLGAISIGALMCHRRTAGSMDKAEVTTALALADSLTPALLTDPDDSAAEVWSQQLHRAEVHQATGFISVQLDVSLVDALSRLRAYALSQERPIIEVARDIVARRLRLPRDLQRS